MRYLLEGRRLLERGAYFNVDPRRCGAYLRLGAYYRKYGNCILISTFRGCQYEGGLPGWVGGLAHLSDISPSLRNSDNMKM